MFETGQEVRLIYTGEIGVVTGYAGQDVLKIISEGIEFTVPVSAVSTDLDEPTPEPEDFPVDEADEIEEYEEEPLEDLDTQRLLLAFAAEDEEHYRLFVINEAAYSVQCELLVATDNTTIWEGALDLDGLEIWSGPAIHRDLLNDKITADSVWHYEDTSQNDQRFLRITPAKFFRGFQPHPWFEGDIRWYVLADSPQSQKQTDHAPIPLPPKRTPTYTRTGGASPAARAGLARDVDLHIEQLMPQSTDLPPGEIIRIQLDACQVYLDQALRYGLTDVYVIHGVGKGKLRREVAAMLESHPHVKRIEQGYHPGYGDGATRVWFT